MMIWGNSGWRSAVIHLYDHGLSDPLTVQPYEPHPQGVFGTLFATFSSSPMGYSKRVTLSTPYDEVAVLSIKW